MRKLFLYLPTIIFLLMFFVSAKSGNTRKESSQKNSDESNSLMKNELVCTECHSGLVDKKIKHAAAIDNGCTNCHISNGKEHPGDSTVFSLADKTPAVCYACHDAIGSDIAKSPVIHGIVDQQKSCMSCHSPHSSDNEKLLVLAEKELCLSCHNKTITSGSVKLTNIKQLLKNSKTIHPPVEEGCIACHKPHASQSKYLLTKNFPASNYAAAKKDSFALCFECHDSGLLEQKSTTSATSFRNGNVNLHYLHMNGSKARNCTLCHDMHAAANEHLIQDKVMFGQWELKLNYTPLETGGSCSPGCHSEKKYVR